MKKSKFFLIRFWRWLNPEKKPTPTIEPQSRILREPKDFTSEYNSARKTWQSLLPTRLANSGLVFESESLRVTKTNDQIFKVEGVDFSLLLVTESSLYEGKDGKWNGILLAKEGALNASLRTKPQTLELFLNALGKPEIQKLQGETQKKQKENQIEKIQDWPLFWKEQLILCFSSNTLALVCLGLGDEMKSFIQKFATEKQQSLVRDELYYLSLSSNHENAVRNKNRNFYEFSEALDEFYLGIEKIEKKQELEKLIEIRKRKKRVKK